MSSEDIDGVHIPEHMYAYGSHVLMKHRRPISISVEKFWSAFDDYLTFQKSLFLHEDTRLEPGPINGPGATISFMYRGSRTYETLDVKDDEKKIWKISLPRANAMFSFYEATISLYEGECGRPPEAQAVLDGVFIEKDDKTRRAYIDSISRVWVTRIRELCEYVLDRDGLRQKHDFIIKCPISDVWKVVGNWNDVSWVTGAVDVKVQDAVQKTRTVTLENGGEVFEYEKLNSDEEKRLVYIVEKSTGSLPVQLYRGDLQLIDPLNMPDLTIVSYNITLLLNEGLDSEKTMNQIALGLRSNFTKLQKMFEKTVS